MIIHVNFNPGLLGSCVSTWACVAVVVNSNQSAAFILHLLEHLCYHSNLSNKVYYELFSIIVVECMLDTAKDFL